MTLWLRVRQLDILTAIVVTQTLALIVMNDQSGRTDLTMFLAVPASAGLALALLPRETAREESAVRRINHLDATLVLLTAATITGLLQLATPLAVQPVDTLQWSSVFAIGLTPLVCRLLSARTAAAIVAATLVVLYVTRYLDFTRGPYLALIHNESPPAVAWTAAATALTLGTISLLLPTPTWLQRSR